ncbi:MAG: hypothetical protein M5U26_27150 [Planctomycetota bacterium]|nr:hypothetical protein [Planctomycetota bacterium]
MPDASGATPEPTHAPGLARDRAAWALLALALGWGLFQALRLWWHCDDAYLGYRYAQNLVNGQGLVFNPGERVEGFTDLLWILWVALGMALGAGPETWANATSVFCYAGALLLLGLLPLRLRARYGLALPWAAPFAALAGAFHPDWNVYATSGIETTPFALALLGGYAVLVWQGVTPARALAAGALFGAASLLRPDGMLPAAVAGVYVLWQAPRRALAGALFAAGVAFFWAPAQAWRMAYYGDFFPNTYYAKSASLPWYEQGAYYAWVYLRTYWSLFMLVPLGAFAAWRWRRERPSLREGFAAPGLFALALAASYTFYVIRVGGDFMFARLLIPATPFYLLALDLLLLRAPVSPRLRAGCAAFLTAGPALVIWIAPIHGYGRWIWNEWGSYAPEVRARYDELAAELRACTEDLPVRVLIFGSEARIAYKAGFHEILEGHGLTDRVIARRELQQRGVPGHEKLPTVDYVLFERRMHFMFRPDGYVEPMHFDRFIPYYTVRMGSIEGFVLTWDPELMEALRSRGAGLRDFRADLDAYLAGMQELSDARVAADFARFWNFYFAHTDDPARERPFIKRLGLAARPKGLLLPGRP